MTTIDPQNNTDTTFNTEEVSTPSTGAKTSTYTKTTTTSPTTTTSEQKFTKRKPTVVPVKSKHTGITRMTSTWELNLGILIMRLGLGTIFIVHGLSKLIAGPEAWQSVGESMKLLGVDFMPSLWGFLAAFAEFSGGILLILGFLFTPAILLLFFTMIMASIMHYHSQPLFAADFPYLNKDAFIALSHPLKMVFVFLGLLFIGPGLYSLDEKLFDRYPD